jgi:nucleoside-diphosphate-sugar epimerase
LRQLDICVVGGEGYIGTRLSGFLRARGDLVTIIDIGWYSDISHSTRGLDIRTNSPAARYDVVIWLAGHSSVGMCRSDKEFMETPAYMNNVVAFNNYLSSLRLLPNDPKPLIIYASSASIYGDTKGKFANEDQIPWDTNFQNWCQAGDREIYDMTKMCVDNLAYRYYSDTGNMIVGLRFGTVNGPSSNMRTELMLNSMVHDACDFGKIYYSQPNIYRSILDIDDLCHSVNGLIIAHEKKDLICGTYNMASYTRTVYELAEVVQRVISRKVELIGNHDALPSKYNFKLDCTKLRQMLSRDSMPEISPSVEDTVNKIWKLYISNDYTPTNRNDPHD